MKPEDRKLFEGLEPMHLLAILVYGEARGENIAGKIAVANVVLNRVNDKRWGDTIAEVALQPKQFSCFNDSDRNFPILLEKAKRSRFADKDIIWRECQLAAYAVICNWVRDLTAGANHYCVTTLRPYWEDESKITVVIGNHKFFKM